MKFPSVYELNSIIAQRIKKQCFLWIVLLFFEMPVSVFAEGTKQLEPISSPLNSYCKLALTRKANDGRFPFALLDCKSEYRLNIRINDFSSEKIYMGFGDIFDYSTNSIIYSDVKYRVKDPAGNIVSSYTLRPLPGNISQTGYIDTYNKAILGPNINNSNPGGYNPLVLNPGMNGDYILEFEIPPGDSNMRIIEFMDVTVAKGNLPVNGRLWSKAWQLSSGDVNSDNNATYSLFYVYSSDSVVSRFDCNGLAGGVWAIYSNDWGSGTNGQWIDRRRSIPGNTTVQPQHKIFLNDPDLSAFPSGNLGEMIDFKVLPFACDTVITFWAHVSKAGKIEITIDVPPYNPGLIGYEDVQLIYEVTAGQSTLLPAWNGKNAYGKNILNGSDVKVQIRFLNGLSNIPLFDVEDNPKGFKADILRPIPVTGSTKLQIFWDDMLLPPSFFPTSNVLNGCEYTGIQPISGCHSWNWDVYTSSSLGNLNTVNSWWYQITNSLTEIPITLQFRPSKGNITGPKNICPGQSVNFHTNSIPYAQQYIWHLSGPGYSADIVKNAPDTSFSYHFAENLPPGEYTISVLGKNLVCGEGDMGFYSTYLNSSMPPPINGQSLVCTEATYQYSLPGSYTTILWSLQNGEIVGQSNTNPVTIRWHNTKNDTIMALATSAECGTRLSSIPVVVHLSASAGFEVSTNAVACPGLPLHFTDTTKLGTGTLVSRYWEWGNTSFHAGNDLQVDYVYPATGMYTAKLTVTTDQGCITQASRQIRIIPYPVASFAWYKNCIGQQIELNDNSAGIDLTSWNWNFGAAPVTAANLYSEQPEAVFHHTGTYLVQMIVENKYGCRDTVINQITIYNNPKADYHYEIPCQSAGILFTDQSIKTDTLLYQYSWTSKSTITGNEKYYAGTPSLIKFDEATNYEVDLLVTDANGCSDKITKLIAVKPKPATAFDYIDNTDNIMGKLHFRNYTTGAVHYYWDFGNSYTSTLFEPDINYTIEGDYTIQLVATSGDGCNDTTTRRYNYIPGLWLPNAFSPDGDGKNDIFRPVTQRTSLKPYLMNIYNRWGKLVFTSNDPETGWDGTLKSEPCQAGLYTYYIQYKEDKTEGSATISQSGTVMLIR